MGGALFNMLRKTGTGWKIENEALLEDFLQQQAEAFAQLGSPGSAARGSLPPQFPSCFWGEWASQEVLCGS